MSFTLTRDAWKNFKTQNNLSKSPWYSRADVGPTIDKFWTAEQVFVDTPTMTSLKNAYAAAVNLQKAFAKFITLKEAKSELKTAAKAQIQTWSSEIDEVTEELAWGAKTYEKQLLKADAELMLKKLAKAGLR
jgi:hypothetical protein